MDGHIFQAFPMSMEFYITMGVGSFCLQPSYSNVVQITVVFCVFTKKSLNLDYGSHAMICLSMA